MVTYLVDVFSRVGRELAQAVSQAAHGYRKFLCLILGGVCRPGVLQQNVSDGVTPCRVECVVVVPRWRSDRCSNTAAIARRLRSSSACQNTNEREIKCTSVSTVRALFTSSVKSLRSSVKASAGRSLDADVSPFPQAVA